MNIKKIFFNLFYLLIIVSMFSIAAFAAEGERTIQTYGQAEVTAQPDLAKISLAMETRSLSAQEAVNENAILANTVLDALLDFGLSKEEVKTSAYRLNSYREWQKDAADEEQYKIYYQAYNEILIKTAQLDTVGTIIDLAVKAGANNINYINFEIQDSYKLVLQALKMATEQAQEKADTIAKGAGIFLIELSGIKEERTSYAPIRIQEPMLARGLDASSAPTPISPEDVIIKASVIAEFSF